MKPDISVIIPVYNVEHTMSRTIDSVLGQSSKKIEVILVDDGSKDKSSEICDEYASRYQNIRVIHKENGGLGSACNAGINEAKGEFIAFLDSDDWVENFAYEKMLGEAVKNDAEVVFTGLKRINSKSQIIYLNHPKEKKVLSDKGNLYSLMKDMIASAPNDPVERHIQMSAKVVLYKKDLIDKFSIRFENERKFGSEDLLFNLDILKHAKRAVVLPDYFYFYFFSNESLSHKVKEDELDKYIVLSKELQIRYPELMPDLIERCDRMVLGYGRSIIKNLFSSECSKKEKRELFKKIGSNSIWEDINKRYPMRQMKYRNKFLLYLLTNNHFYLYKWLLNMYSFKLIRKA